MLSTRPEPTGSEEFAKTIGMSCVAAWRALVSVDPGPIRTSGRSGALTPAELLEERQKRFDQINGDEIPPRCALEYLQTLYKNPLLPLGVRMRAAAIALPFESPKLSAIANLSPEDFSERLERAITRSGVRLIEAKGEI